MEKLRPVQGGPLAASRRGDLQDTIFQLTVGSRSFRREGPNRFVSGCYHSALPHSYDRKADGLKCGRFTFARWTFATAAG